MVYFILFEQRWPPNVAGPGETYPYPPSLRACCWPSSSSKQAYPSFTFAGLRTPV